MVFYHKIRNLRAIRDQLTMFCFLQCIVENHDHGRKYGNTADHTKYNAFCHNDTKVKTQGKLMKHRAINPAIVVIELPTTDLIVAAIAFAIASL